MNKGVVDLLLVMERSGSEPQPIGEITDMGSEHYCLRWNNHQSNLLGVFSQLLQDESLVDVTLACAEGLSIRAHKVVLSACSSYFQTLFVDHPNRHPIVILKDVRFAELRTLVEFMYKGEVNVEYLPTVGTAKDRREPQVQKHNSPGPPDTPTPEIPASASGSKRLMDEDSATATSLHPHGSISPSPALYGTKRQMLHHRHDSGSCDEGGGGAGGGTPEPDDLSSPPCAGPSDMSMSCNNPPSCSAAACSSALSSRLPSPLGEEPLPGPSGMLPVQQVPLSLKKEVEWDRGGDDKSTTGDSSSDYRHPHDPQVDCGVEPDSHSPRVYSCMYCGAQFPYQSKLTRHILSHSLETLRYREQVAIHHHQQQHQSLTSIAKLEPLNLMESHFGGRPPPPPLSDLSDPSSHLHENSLSVLELKGEYVGGPPPGDVGASSNVVLCKFCGKSFPDVGSLIAHLPVHTGDRPFRCEFCGKAFKLRHHMKDHCRVHTGERPFRCSLCGKTFSRSTILKAHEKTHYPKYVHKFMLPEPPMDTEEESSPQQ
uniref:(California timema) hypothetical protein n=1 Tax=Timema californicum TaxID=61474 RepID=A0A7R9P371_TIMCA|nr:unnamed protein product [Timema californicum]